MAIVFSEQKNKQKILIFVSIGVLLLTGLVLWKGVFNKDTPQFLGLTDNPPMKEKITIDFETVERNRTFLEKLEVFPKIEPFRQATSSVPTEGIGRDNPFKPY